jgi:hypothetical protein
MTLTMIAEISNSGENRPAETAETGFGGIGGSIRENFQPEKSGATDFSHRRNRQNPTPKTGDRERYNSEIKETKGKPAILRN